LKETEEAFYKIINDAPPPYTLYYSTAIETKNINYQKETADLSISMNLLANAEWFTAMQRALKAAWAVQDGLNATGRKKDWELDEWPWWGTSKTNPFGQSKRKKYDIPMEFELVNQQGGVIGRQTARLDPSIYISTDFIVEFNKNTSSILTFYGVNANDISDNLTIRVASVNRSSPETARFAITAVSGKEFPKYQVQTRRTAFTDSRDGRKYKAIEIGALTWMAENLNFNAKGSKCYGEGETYKYYHNRGYIDKPRYSPSEIQANCQKYGRLYDWNTAMKACPKDWHLPSREEWYILELSIADDKSGKFLKATSGWNGYNGKSGNGTDAYGFSALPGGRGRSDGSFRSVGSDGYWWGSSEQGYGRQANSKSMHYNNDYLGYYYHSDSDDKDNLLSVRCVKDD